MSKIAVVYWSGTGHTEAMADAVADGAKGAGAEVSVFTAHDFKPEMVDDYDAIAFGCPSMGAEQLEEGEFEPMFSSCESKLKFGSSALYCINTLLVASFQVQPVLYCSHLICIQLHKFL